MNASIEEVNEYLTEANDKASKDNEEKFSKFLYKLDRTNGITKEQRKQFIGIYQMMNIFTRDAGVAADSAVMVIDASKGVEKQTIKLFKVCVMRHIPIFTFI